MTDHEIFEQWWLEQTRQGDPARRLNLQRDAFIAGMLAARATAEQSKDKWVAIVRVTNEGYAMELSKYIAYALPEGTHKLYAAPQAPQSRDSVIEQCAALCDDILEKGEYSGCDIDCYQETADRCAKKIRALKSQQDAAIESNPAEQVQDSVDAKRYRFLREDRTIDHRSIWIAYGNGMFISRWTGEKCDAAIDAAIESQRSGDGS